MTLLFLFSKEKRRINLLCTLLLFVHIQYKLYLGLETLIEPLFSLGDLYLQYFNSPLVLVIYKHV